MSATQLTTDGREIPLELLGDHPTSPTPLSPAQRAVLTAAREGGISSTEAGVIVHRHRGGPCARPFGPDAEGCCRWCATDGAQALKRLERRGLVFRSMVGWWEPVR